MSFLMRMQASVFSYKHYDSDNYDLDQNHDDNYKHEPIDLEPQMNENHTFQSPISFRPSLWNEEGTMRQKQ